MSRTWHYSIHRLIWDGWIAGQPWSIHKSYRNIYYKHKKYVVRYDNAYGKMPKWWVHDFHTKRRRAKVRREIRRALYEDMYECDWPLDKKPQIYYW